MDFTTSRRARLWGFGSFYFVQGLPWGFVNFALSAHLAAQGAGAGAISAVMTAQALPWVAKPLVGVLVDSSGPHPLGQRRVYVLASQALLLPALLSLVWAHDTLTYAIILGLVGLLCAVQDVAGDAMAVHLVPHRERAAVNGVMHASKYGGGFLGGAGAGFLMQHVAPAAGPLLMALAVLGPLIFLMRVPESRHDFSRVSGEGVQRRSLTTPLLSRGFTGFWPLFARALRVGGWLPFALAFSAKLGFALQAPVMPALLSGRFGMAPAHFSALSGGVGLAASALGALMGGPLADHLGRRVVTATAAVIGAAFTLAVALHPTLLASPLGAALFYALSGLASGVYVAALLGMFMGLANRAVAATHFSVLMATINLGIMAGKALGGPLSTLLEYEGVLALSAAATLLAPLLVMRVRELDR